MLTVILQLHCNATDNSATFRMFMLFREEYVALQERIEAKNEQLLGVKSWEMFVLC